MATRSDRLVILRSFLASPDMAWYKEGMKDLQKFELELQWIEANKIRDAEIASLTLQDSVQQLRILYHSLFPLLEKTESLFRPDRENYLNQLQKRLNRLNHSQKDTTGYLVPGGNFHRVPGTGW